MNTRIFPLLACAVLLLGASSQSDSAFVRAAIQGNNAEISSASLNVNSADTRVMQYAGRVRTDHLIANQQLIAIANKLHIDTSMAISQPQGETTPNANGRPNAPNTANQAPKASVYFKQEVAAHKQAIALYRKEAASGRDPALRTYAKQQLPILEKHLQLAQADLKAEEQAGH